MQGYPFVELLAAIGLTNARPYRLKRNDKLNYSYSVISALDPAETVPLPLLQGAPSARLVEKRHLPQTFLTHPPFQHESWLARQRRPGRCILNVTEEIEP